MPGGSKRVKKDIVEQIKDLYMRKKPIKTETNMLIPTKAALFGLEVRFRPVDEKLLEEKKRRMAFRRPKTNKESTTGAHRHQHPMARRLLSSQCQRAPALKGL